MATRKSSTSAVKTVATPVVATPDKAYKATVAGRISWVGELAAFPVKTGKNAGQMLSVFRFELISTNPVNGESTRFKCSVLGPQALAASKLVKGHTCMVTGKYELETFNSKTTGEAGTAHAINVEFLN
jgi:Single-strand binding protein family